MTADNSSASSSGTGLRGGSLYLLIVLTSVNAINWADRQVVPVLFSGIRTDLGLTDTQLGMIGGLAFSLIYAVSAFFFGYLADRKVRKNLVAFGLVAWSLATMASGLAVDFWTLFAARFFTGIGEASLYPCAMSLFAERYPVEGRGRAMGIFGAASAIGGGLGVGGGGYLVEAIGWRQVFFVYGGMGMLLVPALLSLSEEPRSHAAGALESTWKVVSNLFQDVRLLLVWVAGMIMLGSAAGFGAWVPSYFQRVRGMGESEAGQLAGLALLLGGLLGSIGGGFGADRRRRYRVAGELDVSGFAGLVGAPLVAAVVYSESLAVVIPCALLAPVALFAFFPSLQTIIMAIVPSKNLGTAYAVQMLFMAGIGSAAGPLAMGYVSDVTGSLASAMYVPIVGMVIASALILFAGRIIRARQHREGAEGSFVLAEDG